MEKKICLITGCNGGIGKYAAIELAKKNCEIIMLVRDSDKSRVAFEDIKAQSKNNDIKMFYADLSSQESIVNAAKKITKEYSQIDVLINNAGVLKRNREITTEGFEMTLAVNYFAPFLLTNLLLPLLEKSPQGRIINVSSELYKKGKAKISKLSTEGEFDGHEEYANSKLLIVIFTKELARQLRDKNITVNCLHPGVVGTDIFREYPKWLNASVNFFISKPAVGAEPIVHLATSAEVSKISGQYFYKNKSTPTMGIVNDDNISEQIWNDSNSITNITNW